jgi:hypothetical protein
MGRTSPVAALQARSALTPAASQLGIRFPFSGRKLGWSAEGNWLCPAQQAGVAPQQG